MKYKVNIECLDNGWLIRWTRESFPEEEPNFYTSVAYPPQPRPKMQGTEIFTKHADLIKRVKELTA